MHNDDDDQVQVETREAQEAALLDLYNAGLKLMIENKKPAARCYLQCNMTRGQKTMSIIGHIF